MVIKKYNWSKYTIRSDENYASAILNKDRTLISNHNITSGARDELKFIFNLYESHSGKPITIGNALDVCCGAGTMSSELRKEGYSVSAFDLNKDAILLAKSFDSEVKFIVGDASTPLEYYASHKFDLILIREAHPFSRISSPEFHKNLIENYISLLTPNGLIVIAHASIGGGMNAESIDLAAYTLLQDSDNSNTVTTIGPYSFFLLKHLRISTKNKYAVSFLSACTKILQRLVRARWIEFYLIYRK